MWTPIAICVQPAGRIVVPPVTSLAAGLAALARAVPIGLPTRTTARAQTINEILTAAATADRPRFRLPPVVGWTVLSATALWVIGVA